MHSYREISIFTFGYIGPVSKNTPEVFFSTSMHLQTLLIDLFFLYCKHEKSLTAIMQVITKFILMKNGTVTPFDPCCRVGARPISLLDRLHTTKPV
jgi:hypothetical protein